MLALLKRTKNSTDRVGLWVTPEGVAAARLDLGASRPRLVHCSFTDLADGATADSALAELPLDGAQLVSVMAIGSYQLLLVEAPDVPEAELRAAVRWRIKELIDFHVDDAVIDVFEMPEQSRGGQRRMMYAVAARAAAVGEQAARAQGARLLLEAIDIPELALRNVAARLDEDEHGVALLYLGERHGILTLTRQSVIYLTRRIDTGVRTLVESGARRAEQVAGLALEIRRSLDYVESHYDQKPISALYVVGLEPGERNDLALDLAVAVKPLDLTALLTCDPAPAGEVAWRVLPAVGAALRHDPLTL